MAHLEDKQAGLRISFGGCAALGVYHVGVCKALTDHAPNLLDEFEQLYGASAGAMSVVMLVCKCDPVAVYEWLMEMFKISREYSILGVVSPSFDLFSRLRNLLERLLPRDAHRLCRNRVNISLSVIDGGLPRNWLLTDFTTRKELINAVIASSLMPGYGGINGLPLIRGKRCFDGGFTSNIPLVSDPGVISVTPFSGESDICPQMESGSAWHITWCDQPFQITTKNLSRLKMALYPTSLERLEELHHQGYNDCLNYFRKRGLIPDRFTEVETYTSLPAGHLLALDTTTPRDSGYFSRTELSSQSEYDDEGESDHDEEERKERGLVMLSLDHQTGQQLVNSHKTSDCDKKTLILEPQDLVSTFS